MELLGDNEDDWIPTIVKWIESDGDLEIENSIEIRLIQQNIGKSTSVQGRQEYVMSIEDYREGSVDKAVEIMNKQGFGIERVGKTLNAPVSGLDIGSKTKHLLR